MISSLVKIAIVLKPFHKFTYLLAIIIIVHMAYQFLLVSEPSQPQDQSAMFSLLILIWLALINLMFQVFTRIPEKSTKNQRLFSRMKSKLHQGVYYILSLIFIALSVVLIILSFKMFNL